MERPKNIVDKKTVISIRLTIIFHLVGLVGLSLAQTRLLFLDLVPFHLLLMMGILFVNHQKFDAKFLVFFMVIYIAGLMIEWLGVHTGIFFGNYAYGNTLGFKLDGIPLLMGVNWFMLIYATGTALRQTAIKQIWLRILIGATILVLLDLLLEPAAMRFNYWHWVNASAPIANYVCWFVFSALFLLIFELCKFKKQSITGAVLLVSQFIFFLALLSETLMY